MCKTEALHFCPATLLSSNLSSLSNLTAKHVSIQAHTCIYIGFMANICNTCYMTEFSEYINKYYLTSRPLFSIVMSPEIIAFHLAPPTLISASHYDPSDKMWYHLLWQNTTIPAPVLHIPLPAPHFLIVLYPALLIFYLPTLTRISHFHSPHPSFQRQELYSHCPAVFYLILNSDARGQCLLSPSPQLHRL